MSTTDFRETLEWAAEYGITIEIIRADEALTVRASRGRISANYIIDMDEPHGFRGAVWAAVISVRAGYEYHSVHGFTPGSNLGEGTPGP